MKTLIDFSSRFRILKGGKVSLVVSALIGNITLSFAAPSGGTVTSGTANISQSGATTNITQITNKASINWQKFNISSNEIVNFKQPSSSSIILNRVIGNESSVINGALNANGQVWILNSNGVLFGKNASVNTTGILATTAKLSDTDFQNGNYNFTDVTNNAVINEGTIEVKNGGSVILASNEVRNEGTIKAIKGNIHLVGADRYSLNLNGNSLVNLKVDKGVLDALVENSGTIIADGGTIYLTTNAVDELLKGVVNNTGIIEANSLDGLTGHVELFAHGGTAQIGGTIEAKDGFVETSADTVKVSDGFRVKANKWLIDPKDFTIASTGGDMTGTTLSSNLASASVEIQSVNGATEGSGDIFVNDTISWTSDKKLTLNAQNNIFINSKITANGGGQLELLYGQGAVEVGNSANYYINSIVDLQAGDNFLTKLGSDGTLTTWKVITDLGSEGSTTGTDLQGINGNLSGNYVLGANIDATNTLLWNSSTGFTPIGTFGAEFTGKFDGLGHTIDNLFIYRSGYPQYVGLFGYIKNNAIIQNIGLVDVSIDAQGATQVGALVGSIFSGTVFNSYSTGTIKARGTVGGLVGENYGLIKDSYSFINVRSVSVHSGGLVGRNGGTISHSYATGTVIGTDKYIGGLVGGNTNGGKIDDSYATGNVTGNQDVGGFVGLLSDANSAITNSYSSGKVIGTDSATTGGFVGNVFEYNNNGTYGTITNSYWDSDSSEQSSGIGTNSTTAAQTVTELKSSTATVNAFNEATYTGFHFTNDWFILEGDTRPMLRSQHTNNIANQYELQLMAMDKSAKYTINNDIDFGADIQTNQSDIWNTATGFDPIGADFASRFVGTLTSLGNTFTLSNLFINRATTDNVGLIGYAGYGSKISYVNVQDADVTGQDNTGILIGNSAAEIEYSITSGSVTGNDYTGGSAGSSWGDKLVGISSSATVTGNDYVGGVVGSTGTEGGDPLVSGLKATGDVTGANNVGGVIGYVFGVTMTNSSATGDITATGDIAGGFVGFNDGATIETSFATGDVTAVNIAGGFAGKNQSSSSARSNGNKYYSEAIISKSFATGDVMATDKVGGLVGENSTSYYDQDGTGVGADPDTTNAIIQNSYSVGSVTGVTNKGGFVGLNDSDGDISNSYYDKTINSGMSDEATFGQTTSEMKNFTFFDDAGWEISELASLSDVYPQLKWATSGTSGVNNLWVIAPTPEPEAIPTTPSSNGTDSTANNVDDVITSIVNTNAIKVQVPKTINNPKIQTPQMKQVMQKSSSIESRKPQDVRVRLSKNSIVDLINGGVNLPDGLKQQFFAVSDNEN